MRRWGLLFALFAVPLVFVGHAVGRTATVNASGVITADPTIGETYTLTIANTGNENLLCLQFFVPAGVTVTAVAQPQGAFVGFGPTGFGGQFQPPLAPGGTVAIRFQTSAAYPVNGGGKLHVSATCASGSDVIVDATGPAGTAPPPPPPPVPCKCTGVTMTTTPHSFTESDGHTFEFTINYKLKCTGGAGNTCKGEIKPLRPEWNERGGLIYVPSDLTYATNKGLPLSCYGRCPHPSTHEIHIVGHSKADLGPKVRRGNTFLFKFKLYCVTGTKIDPKTKKPVPVLKDEGEATMKVVFDARGFVDRAKSDLNSDGKADKK